MREVDFKKRLIWATVIMVLFWIGTMVMIFVIENTKLQSGEKIIFTIEKK